MTVIGLDPTSATSRSAGTRPTSRSPRPASLDGLTIGVVGNGLNRANEFLDAVVAELRRIANLGDDITITKKGVSVPPDPEDWDRVVKGADVAITGFGGCGSCSSRSMRDAIELEAAGVPTAAIIHEGLFGAATAISRLSGVPDYEFVTAPFPYPTVATWSDDEIAELARIVAPKVVALLTNEGRGDNSSSLGANALVGSQ